MRKILLAVLLVGTLLLAACGGDDDEARSPHEGTNQDTAASTEASVSELPPISPPLESATNERQRSFWLGEPLSREVVNAAAWDLFADSGTAFDGGQYILSVAPSGNNILVATIDTSLDLLNRRRGNPMGFTALHLSVYTREGEVFTQASRIYIESGDDHVWNDIVVNADETTIAWSMDETRILMSGGKTNFQPIDVSVGFSSIFLVDFYHQTAEALTNGNLELIGYGYGVYSDYLPRWMDGENISFVRYQYNADGLLMTSLYRMSLSNRTKKLLADLTPEYGVTFISDYQISGNYIYFITKGDLNKTGLLSLRVDEGTVVPTLLLSVMKALEDAVGEGIITSWFSEFLSVEICSDQRWALLTKRDNRIPQRDIPLTDHPDHPQADPSTAESIARGIPWLAYHNVILFDLHSNQIVDPFIDSALRPTEAIITTATFAPDGKSLIAAVFGDGGEWTTSSFEELSLWQVGLIDNSFEAIRIFRTKAEFSPALTSIAWLGNNSLWIRPTWLYTQATMPHILATPAAFERFVD